MECEAGFRCTRMNSWYSQCLRANSSEDTVPPTQTGVCSLMVLGPGEKPKKKKVLGATSGLVIRQRDGTETASTLTTSTPAENVSVHRAPPTGTDTWWSSDEKDRQAQPNGCERDEEGVAYLTEKPLYPLDDIK